MSLLELTFASGESSLSVRRFSVREQISNPFEVQIVALSPNDEIDLEAINGKPASFTMESGLRIPRTWSGVCSQIGLIQAEETGLSTYELAIVPRFWLLSQRSGNRIFQHKSVPDIVEAILAEWKIEPEMRLSRGTFPKKEYCAQYNETDFSFVERLLEEAGISYFFTGPKSQLVLTDSPEKGEARGGAPIPYVDNPNEAAVREFLSEVHLVHAVRPGKVTIRDFDFRRRTDYKLLGEAEGGSGVEAMMEQYVYAPGAALIETEDSAGDTPVADDKGKSRWDDKELKSRAKRALESRRGDKRRVTFEGNVFDLSPGSVFKVDHPHKSLSPSEGLLATQLIVYGEHDAEWGVSGEAVFASQPFKPALTTQKPVVEGLQSAIVVGPPGEEIHTDEFGRVRVRFHWDREGDWDDNRTCWVRVSQIWAGAMYGGAMIPRIGQEVIIDFYEGDPDQPIIVGRLFNQTAQGPYPLPKHKTKSAWKSESSPGGDGYNEILFEDAAGGELVYVQAQKDMVSLVKKDESEKTGANRSVVVGQSHTASVRGDNTVEVGKEHLLNIVKPKDLQILKQGVPDVEELETKVVVADKKIRITTGDATILLDGPNILIEAKSTLSFLAEGQVIIQGGPNVYLNCDCPPPQGQATCLLAAARTGAAFVQRAP